MAKVFSLHGRGLKLDTRADLAPLLEGIDPTTIEEIHFGGNTLGVEASEVLAEFLAKATNLKVCITPVLFSFFLLSIPYLSSL